MRILLTANASYLPPRGGATRSNLAWLKRLSAAGHECRVLSSALADDASRRAQLRDEGIEFSLRGIRDGIETAESGGVVFLSTPEPGRRVQTLRREIAGFQPDWVLVSSEDVGHGLLREAFQSAPDRVVYLAHTPQWFPFGPETWNPDGGAAALLSRAAAVVAIGEHMAGYIGRHLGRPAVVIHPPIYPPGPWPRLGGFGRGFLTLVNPCAVKGISIFLALADRFPDAPFAVVPGWGTTAADRDALRARPNVRFLPNVGDIQDLLSQTRLLLMPSLWYEGFGLTAMEAMLRGIPVVSSDSGGLVEAKRGTGYVLPVRPIERYEPEFDEHSLPKAVVEPTDIEPWAAAVGRLLADRGEYEREAARSREAAAGFAAGVDPSRMESFLLTLERAEAVEPAGPPRHGVEALSPERRALLLQMLRKRAAEK
jgi:glycosyltransferase involved in cell wall biosynthesis